MFEVMLIGKGVKYRSKFSNNIRDKMTKTDNSEKFFSKGTLTLIICFPIDP